MRYYITEAKRGLFTNTGHNSTQAFSALTSLGAEQEEEGVVILVEVLDGQEALLPAHRPVQPLVRVP